MRFEVSGVGAKCKFKPHLPGTLVVRKRRLNWSIHLRQVISRSVKLDRQRNMSEAVIFNEKVL